MPSSSPLDPTFGSGGIATSSLTANLYPNGMALQGDGKVLEVGDISTSAGSKIGLARYTASGSPDTSFGKGGEVTISNGTHAHGYGAMALANGQIMIAGSTGGFLVARSNSNGSLDNTFGSKGMVTTTFGSYGDAAGALAIQADGKIIAAGNSTQPYLTYTQTEFALARYNPNGTLDTTLGSGGKVLTSFTAQPGYNPRANLGGIALQSDGKIVVAGSATPAGSIGSVFTIARYNSNGTLDTTFGANHTGIVQLPFSSTHADQANGVVIQPDGKIVAAGWVRAAGVIADEWGLARVNADGSVDSTFGSGGEVSLAIDGTPVYGVEDDAWAVALQADSRIVVAGTHGPASGSGKSFAVGRFNTDGSLDTTFNGTGTVTTMVGTGSDARGMAIQPADGKLVVVGSSSLGAAAVRFLAADPSIGSFTAGQNPVSAGGSETLTVSNLSDSNPNGTIVQVAFYYIDGTGTKQVLGYGTQTSPGVWTLTFSVNLAPGTYTVFAQAQDNYGLLSDPFALTLTVN